MSCHKMQFLLLLFSTNTVCHLEQKTNGIIDKRTSDVTVRIPQILTEVMTLIRHVMRQT